MAGLEKLLYGVYGLRTMDHWIRSLISHSICRCISAFRQTVCAPFRLPTNCTFFMNLVKKFCHSKSVAYSSLTIINKNMADRRTCEAGDSITVTYFNISKLSKALDFRK
jgi:hypothetical protein